MSTKPNRISRYEIKSPIGGGGMGTLYLARDPNTGRLVALKLLRANLDSGDLRARFAREAQALASLNHPNIVNIYDSGEFRGAPFMVMEYVRGETLGEKIKRRAPLTLGQKLKLLIELCSGLAHAHDAGIIHRDIKPANLMVDQHGRLKLVDFGIARVAETLTRVGAHVTQLNMQIGTPGYMSPEQIEGNEVDPRSDLFAVGAVAYELLTGHEAFSGANTRQIERKVLQAQPAPITSLARVDPGIADIVNRALEKDPNRRFQDAQSMEMALDQQRLRLGPADTPVPPRLTPQPGMAKPRGSRADQAYQHSVTMLNEGAPESARRHLLEALAEEPGHPAAQTLLAEIDGGTPRAESTLLASVPADDLLRDEATDYSPGHAGSTEDSAILDPTVVIRPRLPSPPPAPRRRTADLAGHVAARPRPAGTDYGPERDEPSERFTNPQDPTVVVRPKSAATPTRKAPTPRPQWAAAAALWDPRTWSRQTVLLAVAIPVALAAVAGGLWLWRPWAAGHVLTVTRPEGGTLTAAGITCGAGGSTCSASFSNNEMLEFEARAEDGFTFTGFTGDCAPGGRMMMDAPRECGATFERTDVAAGAVGDLLLTIAPPTNGTIVGQGVLCGSQGKECSGKFSAGFVLELEGHADAGYVFKGFTGDCGPDGKTIMDAPRTCGASFVGSSPVKNAAGTDTTPLTGGGRPGGGRPGGGGGSGPGGGPGGNSGPNPGSNPGSNSSANPGANPGANAGPNSTPSTGGGTGTSPGGPAPGGGPVVTVGGAEEPGKGVKPVVTREEASRKLIDEALARYLAAYGRLDYQDLLTVFPTAPRNIRVQLDQYQSLEYSFGGPPRFVTFDPDGGSAVIELDFKQVFKPKVGGEQKPNEGRVTFRLHRVQNDDWLIDSAVFRPKK